METKTIDGVALAYETAGDPAGGPVLLIHGMIESCRSWRLTTGVLAQAGWRTLAADNPGHGRSAAPDDPEAYRVDHVADLLHGLARETGFAPGVVIGHSFGGAIAEAYAVRHPDDVTALVLVDTAGGPERADAHPPEIQALYARERDLAFSQGMEAVWDLHQEHGLWASAVGASPEAQAFLKARFCRVSPQGYIHSFPATVDRPDSLPDLARLKPRTLIVCGEHEAEPMLDTSREMAAGIPGARLEIIPRAGHTPQFENAARFNEILLGFLAET